MCLARYGRRVKEFCSRTSAHGFLLAILLLSSATETQAQRWLRQPSDKNVTVGGNVTFHCEAEGVENLTHIWTQGVNPIFLNGAPAPNTPKRYRIEGKNNLVIVGVTLEDDQFYSCTIFNFDAVQVKLTVLLPPGPPAISVNSSSPQLVENSVISLTCSSTGGKPPPTFRWLRNGQLVNSAIHTPPPTGDELGTSSSQVIVTLSREDHLANYSCVVFNAANQKSPLIATRILNVQYSPSIQIAPAFSPYYVKQGTNIKLTCNVDANPTYNFIEWKKNGRMIQRDSATLTLNSIQKGSSGNYTCTASNSIGGNAHTSVSSKQLEVIYAPAITTENLIITNVSTPVNLTCLIDANPAPTSVYWQKLDSSNTYPGPSFSFVAARRYDGNYSCTAVSRLEPSGMSPEDVSSKGYTTVKVQYPPGQAVISPITPVLVGQPIVLTCNLDETGYPLPKYEWRKYGNSVPVQSTSSPIFRINSATLADTGNYTCIPRNIMGQGKAAVIEVQVNSAPVFIQSTPSKPLLEVSIDHTNLALEHKIEGRPLPGVEWLKDGIPVSVMADLYRVETTNIIVEQYKYRVTTRLTFAGTGRDHTRLRIEDIGNYTCQVASTATQVPTERTTQLSIQFKPEIIEHNRVASNLSENTKLRCIIQGNPQPVVSWYKQGNILSDGDKYTQRLRKIGGIETYEATLSVRQIAQADFADYLCEASNTKGTKMKTITLSPRGKPDTPHNLVSISKTWESVKLQWEAGFDGGYMQAFFISVRSKPDAPRNLVSISKTWESVKLQWEAGFDGGYMQAFFISVRSVHGEQIYDVRPPSATDFNVTKLMPYTSYTFQVFGQNNAGQGEYSDGTTAQTGVLVFPPLKEIPQYNVQDKQILVPNDLNHSYCLRMEVSTDDGKAWNVVEPCIMATEGVVPLSVAGATHINVSVCLVYRPKVCGEPVVSAIHDSSNPGLKSSDVIIIGCCCAGILVILLIILIVIIYRRQKRKNNFNQDPHSPRTVQQGNGALPNQKSRGFDNPDGVPSIDTRNGYPTQFLHNYAGDPRYPLEDTSYDSHTFDTYEYEMNRRNANISEPYYHDKQQQGDLSFTGSPRTPTKDPQQFINVPEDNNKEGGSFGSGHESGYSTPDPAKPKKVIYEVVV